MNTSRVPEALRGMTKEECRVFYVHNSCPGCRGIRFEFLEHRQFLRDTKCLDCGLLLETTYGLREVLSWGRVLHEPINYSCKFEFPTKLERFLKAIGIRGKTRP